MADVTWKDGILLKVSTTDCTFLGYMNVVCGDAGSQKKNADLSTLSRRLLIFLFISSSWARTSTPSPRLKASTTAAKKRTSHLHLGHSVYGASFPRWSYAFYLLTVPQKVFGSPPSFGIHRLPILPRRPPCHRRRYWLALPALGYT